MKIKIFTEDIRAKAFFDILNEKLKNMNIVCRSYGIDTSHLPGASPCNSKQTRAINAASTNYDKILIIVDADGPENLDRKKATVEKHIENSLRSIVNIVICDYELEEWICKSLNINYGNKPCKDLNQYCKSKGYKKGYRKSEICKFAKDIDIELLKNIRNYSFGKYLDFLQSNN